MTTTFKDKSVGFKSFNLNDNGFKLIEMYGFKHPTKIQSQTLPQALKDRSIVAQSPTGSGKTLAFLLPIINKLDLDNPKTQALIILPTRELAIQIWEEIKKIRKEIDFSAVNLIGGTDKNKQISKVENQKAQVVIGTPGRINDFILNHELNVADLNQVVFDEADMVFDFGFKKEVASIIGNVLKSDSVQFLIFSATLNDDVRNLFVSQIENPHVVITQKRNKLNRENLTNYLISDKNRADKIEILENIIENTQSFVFIIFARTKQEVDEIYLRLKTKGKNVAKLHGSLPARERKNVILNLKKHKYEYVVCTDIAARGLDIDAISHVFNFSLPKEDQYFIHRIGRTARMDNTGTTFTFFNHTQIEDIKRYENKGLEFTYVKFDKDGSIILEGDYKKRSTRGNFDQKIDEMAWNKVRKEKKVKPGYKRKMKSEKDRIKKRLKREHFKNSIKAQKNKKGR